MRLSPTQMPGTYSTNKTSRFEPILDLSSRPERRDHSQRTMGAPFKLWLEWDTTTIHPKFASSLSALKWFAREVIERTGQQGKHQNRHPIVMQGIGGWEQQHILLARSGFIKLQRDAHQPHDAAGRDQPAGIKRARTDLTLAFRSYPRVLYPPRDRSSTARCHRRRWRAWSRWTDTRPPRRTRNESPAVPPQ